MTPRKAPEAVLVALAEAVDKYDRTNRNFIDWDPTIEAPLRRYQAAVAPLRTRAEVDAEIVGVVRNRNVPGGYGFASSQLDTLRRLCSEATADETEPESIEERHKRMNTAGIRQMFDTIGKKWAKEREPNATTDHGADLRDPEPCGCEEAEALRERLGRIRHLSVTYVPEFPLSAIERIRKECG